MVSGTAEALQFAEPDAVPERPVLVCHITRTGPLPPDVVPEMEI